MSKFINDLGANSAPEVFLNSTDVPIVISDAKLLFSAEFERAGPDLLLVNEGSDTIRIIDYFRQANPQDLESPEGSVLRGELVEKLAGPNFPGQMAQAGAVAGSDPIGQVESLSGETTVQRADGTVETLQLGGKVYANDVVKTRSGGALSLTFLDGTIFTLAENSRMILDELIFDPSDQDSNSGVFNLVEGTFVFIAGQVAKTGGMEINTPAATMGIRGTTVKVDIVTTNGITTVEVSLNQDPDGETGQFTITRLDGTVIADVSSTLTKWIVSPVEGETREIPRTSEDLASDQIALTEAVRAFDSANNRVEIGGEYVETNGGPGDEAPPAAVIVPPDDGEGPPRDGPEERDGPPEQPPTEGKQPDGPGPKQPGEGEQPDGREGNLGSGLNTEVASDSVGDGGLNGQVGISGLGGDDPLGGNLSGDQGGPAGDLGQNSGNRDNGAGVSAPVNVTENQPDINTTPVLELPDLTTSVNEDGSIAVQGFFINDPEGNTLTATLVAGSTVTLVPGSGVTILEGTGVNDVRVVIQGTADQINDALNGTSLGSGLTYSPSPNADDEGTLTITVSDGEFSVTNTLFIDITPIQDAPEANADTISVAESNSLAVGNVLSNDTDPDVTPTPDVLSVVGATHSGSTPITFGVAAILPGGGTFFISANGSYSFQSGTAYNALAAGTQATETVNYTVTDGNGNFDTATLTITIVGANDAPILLASNVFTGENTALTAIDIISRSSDVDTGDTITVTSIDFNGTSIVVGVPTTLPGVGGVFLMNASGIMTFNPSGAFDSLSVGQSQALDFTLVAEDSQGAQATDTFTVLVNGTNDAPIISVTSPAAFSEGTAPTVSNQSVELTNFVSATDVDAADTPAIDTGSISIVTASSSASTLTGAFSVSGTEVKFDSADFDALKPGESGLFDVNFNVVSGADTVAETVRIRITGSNDGPVVSGDFAVQVAESTTVVLTTADIDVTDVDDAPADLTYTVTTLPQWGDVVLLGASPTVISSFTHQQLIDGSIGYRQNGAPNADAIGVSVADGGEGGVSAATATINIAVTAVNNDPTATGLPTSISVDEDVQGQVDLSNLQLADVDAGSSLIALKLTPGAGSLIASSTALVTVASVGSTLTLTGTVVDLNTYLDTTTNIQYVSATDANAPDTINVAVNDNGNTGAGGGTDIALGAVAVNINPINDDPTLAPATHSLNAVEDVASGLDLTTLDFSDVDAGTSSVIVKLIAGSGTFNGPEGGGDPGVAGTGTSTLTLSGSLALIETYLSTAGKVQYTSDTHVNGTDTFSVVVNDGGNTGAGGGTDITVLNTFINISAVNDDPSALNVPTSLAVTEDTVTNVDLSAVNFIDFDAGTASVTVKLVATAGTLAASGGSTDPTISGSGTGTLTLTGSLDLIETFLNNANAVQYTPVADANGSESIGIVVNDGGNTGAGGGTDVTVGTVPVTISAVNDDPILEPATHSLSVVEDVASGLDLTSLNFTDVDAGSSNVTVTLTSVSGTLSAIGGSTDPAIGGSGTKTITLTGSIDLIETYLGVSGQVQYTSAANANGTDALSVTINDGGNTGSGGGTDINVVTIPIAIGAVNDDPSALNVPTSLAVTEDTVTNVDLSAVNFIDVDAGTASVTVKLVATAGTLAASGGSTDPTISGSGTGTLTLTGSLDLIETFLNNANAVQYTPVADANGSESIGIVVNDGGNTGAGGGTDVTVGTVPVTISAVNDDPTASGAPSSISASEDTTFGLNLSTIDFVDIDAGTAAVDVILEASAGTITAPTGGSGGPGISGSGTNKLTLNGSLSDIETFLDNVNNLQFTGDANVNGLQTLTIKVNDGGNVGTGGGTDVLVSTITIDLPAINDAPTIAGTPTGLTFTEDTGGTIDFSSVVFTDVDGGTGNFTATITIPSGSITPPSSTFITIAPTINGFTFNGSLAELNSYFATNGSMPYTPAADFNGSFTGQISINDNGNNGAGLALSDTQALNITVSSVNDDPTATGIPTSFAAVEDVASNIDLSGIDFTDVDASAMAQFKVILLVSGGTLSATGGGGVSVANSGTNDVSLTGTLSDIEAFLNTASAVQYTSALNALGTVNLTIKVNDGGNSGTGGGTDVAVGTVPITISAVNDAPTATGIPLSFAVTEDTVADIDLSAVDFTDVDAGTASVTVKLVTTAGTLAATGGSGDPTITGSGTGTLSLAGSLDEIETFLNTTSVVQYTPLTGASGTETLTVQVNDGGNSGAGAGSDVTVGTSSLSISGTNDAPVITVPVVTTSLSLLANTANGGANLLHLVVDLQTAKLAGKTYVLATSRTQDSISVFELQSDGTTTLTGVQSETLNSGLFLDQPRQIAVIENSGGTFVFASGRVDNGITAFQLGTDGSLTSVDTVSDGSGNFLDNPATLETATVGGTSYLFVAALDDDAVTTFSVSTTGQLTKVNQVGLFDNVFDFEIFQIGGSTFMVVAVNDSDRLKSYKVNANGSLTFVSTVNDTASLGLDGVRGLTSAEIDGTVFVFAASEIDDAISVFSVSPIGVLTPVFTLNNSASTLLNEAYSLSVTEIAGEFFLASVARSDNAVVLYKIASDGSLTEVDREIDDAANLIHTPVAVATTTVDGVELLIVGGEEQGFSVFNIATTNPTIAEGGNGSIQGISIADSDAGANNVTVTLSVPTGNLTLSTSVSGGLTTADISNNGTSTVTITAPIAAINATLANGAGLNYAPGPNVNGEILLTINVDDLGNTGGGSLTDSETIAITVLPVNTAPAGGSLPGSITAVEDVASAVDLSGMVLLDTDSGDGLLTVTLTAGAGTLTPTAGADISVTSGASATITGTLADLQTYLATSTNILYTGPADANGAAFTTIAVSVTDNGNSGAGGALTTNIGSFNVNITAVNDVPGGIDEDSFAGTIAELSDGSSAENNSIREVRIGVLKFSDVDSTSHTFSITPVTGNPAVPFTVTFRTNITDPVDPDGTVEIFARIQDSELDALTSTDSFSLGYNISIDDGSGGVTPVPLAMTLTVNGTNDTPELTSSTTNINVLENDPAALVNSTIVLTDPDATNLTGATVSITTHYVEGEDVLAFNNVGAITGNFVAATGTVTFTGSGTVAEFQTALRSVTYTNTSENPSNLVRTVSFNVSDEVTSGPVFTSTINPTGVNDAPVLTIPTAGANLLTNGSFEDGPATSATPSVQVESTTTPTAITGWTITSGNVDHIETFANADEGVNSIDLFGNASGAIEQSFTTVIGETYVVSFALSGITGAGTTIKNLDVGINGSTESFNFDSTGQTPPAVTYQQESFAFTATNTTTTLAFSSPDASSNAGPIIDDVVVQTPQLVVNGSTASVLTGLSVADVDAGTGNIAVSLVVTNGIVALSDSVSGGLTTGDIVANGTASVVLNGTLAEINATLAAAGGIEFQATNGFSGAAKIDVLLGDQGLSGSGTALTDTDTIFIAVNPSTAPSAVNQLSEILDGTNTTISAVQFVGESNLESAGTSAITIGDINNDGIDDYAIGGPQAQGTAGGVSGNAGKAYIIYGGQNLAPFTSSTGEISLSTVGTASGPAGFQFLGEAAGDRVGESIAALGDINKDGIDDFIIGANQTDSAALNSGSAYVIYGNTNSYFSNLTNLDGEIAIGLVGNTTGATVGGFEFRHNEINEFLGKSVSSAGDINGDGIDDILIGGPTSTATGRGNAFVVYGGQTAPVDANGEVLFTEIPNNLQGFQLVGAAAGDAAGESVASVGDFNGDGFDDILVGGPLNDTVGSNAGQAYLIYGGQDFASLTSAPDNRAIALSLTGGSLNGVLFNGDVASSFAGLDVAGVGDLNNDGLQDIAISTTLGAQVIFGSTTLSGTISLSGAGLDGFSFTQPGASGFIDSVSSAGDINGDGIDDLLLANQETSILTSPFHGSAWVVYGGQAGLTGTINVSSIGTTIEGFEVQGESTNDFLGLSASAAGDVNNDGFDDIFVGSAANDDGGSSSTGAGYIIYGSDFNGAVDFLGNAAGNTFIGTGVAETFIGGAGNDVIDGNGGADRIDAGTGNDTIRFRTASVNSGSVEGGSGQDTLFFEGIGSIDLTAVSNGRFSGVEELGLQNGVTNTLTLGIDDVFNLSDETNTQIETALGRYVANSVLVRTDASDIVNIENGTSGGGWVANPTDSGSIAGFNIFDYQNSGGDVLATLAIDDDVTPNIIT